MIATRIRRQAPLDIRGLDPMYRMNKIGRVTNPPLRSHQSPSSSTPPTCHSSLTLSLRGGNRRGNFVNQQPRPIALHPPPCHPGESQDLKKRRRNPTRPSASPPQHANGRNALPRVSNPPHLDESPTKLVIARREPTWQSLKPTTPLHHHPHPPTVIPAKAGLVRPRSNL